MANKKPTPNRSLKVTQDVHHKLRMAAAKGDVKITDLLERLILDGLKAQAQKPSVPAQ